MNTKQIVTVEIIRQAYVVFIENVHVVAKAALLICFAIKVVQTIF